MLLGGRESPHLYTLISDLAAGEEIDASCLLIGHKVNLKPSKIFLSPNGEKEDIFQRELASILDAERTLQFSKREKAFDFVSVPVCQNFEGTNRFASDLLSTTTFGKAAYNGISRYEIFMGNFPLLISDIAYEFTTDLLCSLTPEQLEDVLRMLSNNMQTGASSSKAPNVHLLIATNVFSVRAAVTFYSNLFCLF